LQQCLQNLKKALFYVISYWINYLTFLAITCKPQTLNGQSIAVNMRIFASFILEEKASKLPVKLFSGPDDAILKALDLPSRYVTPKEVQTQKCFNRS